MGHKQAQQKEHYDTKSQGRAYSVGDLVWLHTPAVPRGQSKKLHRLWQGPFRVVAKPSEVVYPLQHVQCRRQQPVVHFNRLKPCSSGVRLLPEHQWSQETPHHIPPRPVGAGLELLDDDAQPLTSLPERDKAPPTHITPFPAHPSDLSSPSPSSSLHRPRHLLQTLLLILLFRTLPHPHRHYPLPLPIATPKEKGLPQFVCLIEFCFDM